MGDGMVGVEAIVGSDDRDERVGEAVRFIWRGTEHSVCGIQDFG